MFPYLLSPNLTSNFTQQSHKGTRSKVLQFQVNVSQKEHILPMGRKRRESQAPKHRSQPGSTYQAPITWKEGWQCFCERRIEEEFGKRRMPSHQRNQLCFPSSQNIRICLCAQGLEEINVERKSGSRSKGNHLCISCLQFWFFISIEFTWTVQIILLAQTQHIYQRVDILVEVEFDICLLGSFSRMDHSHKLYFWASGKKLIYIEHLLYRKKLQMFSHMVCYLSLTTTLQGINPIL